MLLTPCQGGGLGVDDMKFFKHNGPTIGIDLGTTNILVYVKNKGLVVKEPSLLAVDAKTKKIVAVGQKAKKMQRLELLLRNDWAYRFHLKSQKSNPFLLST